MKTADINEPFCHRKRPSCLKLWGATMLLAGNLAVPPDTATAQSADVLSAVNEPEKPKIPAIKFQILKSRKVGLGDRALFLHRVVPPVLPKVIDPPAPEPRELSAAELEIEQRREHKEFKMLFLSATVYDRQVTDLRWWEGGKQYRVFSNIDFNYVAGMGEFESESAVYMLLMGLGNEARKDVTEWNRYVTAQGFPKHTKTEVPSARAFPAGRSSYFIAPEADFVAAWNRHVSEQGLPAEEMLTPRSPSDPPESGTAVRDDKTDDDIEPYAALDALHVFYDTNKQRLTEEYEKREAANAENARYLKEHPPVPKDVVVNYWRKPSELPKARGTK